MNYYPPNYYVNYPYSNMPQYIPQQQTYQQVPQTLTGKIVDSEEVVKATEVPIGGYGIFPKADLSEIYIKSWNNNGTTSVITFKPIIQQNQQEEAPKENEIEKVLNQIQILDNKLDTILKGSQTISNETPVKKEMKISNVY